jgi:hypothetical protein
MLTLNRKLDWCSNVPNGLYYTYMHRILEHTLTRSVVRVAYPAAYEENGEVYSGNTGHIIGFIVADVSAIGLIVHYVYVRTDYTEHGMPELTYTGQGIARTLLDGMLKDYKMDHVVYTIRSPFFRRNPNFAHRIDFEERNKYTYNPFLLFTLMPHQWERGIVASLNETEMKKYREVQAEYVPVDF